MAFWEEGEVVPWIMSKSSDLRKEYVISRRHTPGLDRSCQYPMVFITSVSEEGEGVETSGTGFWAVSETDQLGRTSTPSVDASAATVAPEKASVRVSCRPLGGMLAVRS